MSLTHRGQQSLRYFDKMHTRSIGDPANHDPVGATRKVGARPFYGTYHGHEPALLEEVLGTVLRAQAATAASSGWLGAPLGDGTRRVIFLAGDSSLDNKYWLPFKSSQPGMNGYEHVLDPPSCIPDVAYCINKETVARGLGPGLVCLNAAVEESTLGSRHDGRTLNPQDQFIRDHIRADDVLVVSVGGNDIALRPSPSTIACMGSLIALSAESSIQAGTAVGLGHFVTMFGSHTSQYIKALCSKTMPKLVIVCMIYYPHEKAGGSWADGTLRLLAYDSHPGKLQLLIRKVFELGTRSIRVPGTHVVSCPFFDILNPAVGSEDYIARVEPSEAGGVKMAKEILDIIQREYCSGALGDAGGNGPAVGDGDDRNRSGCTLL